MDADQQKQLADAGHQLLQTLEIEVSSPEARQFIEKVIEAVMEAAKAALAVVSPGILVPFEGLIINWIEPKIEGLVDEKLKGINPTNQPEEAGSSTITEIPNTPAAPVGTSGVAHAVASQALKSGLVGAKVTIKSVLVPTALAQSMTIEQKRAYVLAHQGTPPAPSAA
jgi:hypothetical protein